MGLGPRVWWSRCFLPSFFQFSFAHAFDFTLSDLVHRIRARQVRVRGASVATAQQAPGSVPWTARARVGTLARGLPPRRGVRAPRLHALSLSFFGHIGHIFVSRFGFGLQPLPLRNIPQHGALPAVLRTYAALLFLRRHRHGRSGDVFAAVVAYRPRASAAARCHILGPKVFLHSIFFVWRFVAFKTWRGGAP